MLRLPGESRFLGGEVATSWCDKLDSKPTAGLRLNAKFRTSERILDSISPLLEDQTRSTGRGEIETFQIEQREVFRVVFSLRDGFRYEVSPMQISVGFAPKFELRIKSAGAPRVQVAAEGDEGGDAPQRG